MRRVAHAPVQESGRADGTTSVTPDVPGPPSARGHAEGQACEGRLKESEQGGQGTPEPGAVVRRQARAAGS